MKIFSPDPLRLIRPMIDSEQSSPTEEMNHLPECIYFFEDRDSLILACAAAKYFGVPSRPWIGFVGNAPSLIVVYDLMKTAEEYQIQQLQYRYPAQILWSHVTHYNIQQLVIPDYTTLFVKKIIPPWDKQFFPDITQDSKIAVQEKPTDERCETDIAETILCASDVSGWALSHYSNEKPDASKNYSTQDSFKKLRDLAFLAYSEDSSIPRRREVFSLVRW